MREAERFKMKSGTVVTYTTRVWAYMVSVFVRHRVGPAYCALLILIPGCG